MRAEKKENMALRREVLVSPAAYNPNFLTLL